MSCLSQQFQVAKVTMTQRVVAPETVRQGRFDRRLDLIVQSWILEVTAAEQPRQSYPRRPMAPSDYKGWL
jgi:hypothetical protein